MGVSSLPSCTLFRPFNAITAAILGIFESLSEAKEAALTIASRTQETGKPKISIFATGSTSEDEELQQTLSELTEDRVGTYYFSMS